MPPTIPTSFIPQSASASARHFRSDFTGAFGFFAYAVLGVVFLLAILVFFYGGVLSASKTSKDMALANAQASIDPATVENFVKLRNRLTSGESLLEKHVAFSPFFALLERLLPESVRFTLLNLSVSNTGTTKVEAAGIAKSFNALAVASNAFAADGRIKDAIFSNISVTKNGFVSFALSATLDPKLISFTSPSAGSFAPEPTMTEPAPAESSATTAPPTL